MSDLNENPELTASYVRTGDPETSAEAAGKARPRVQFYVDHCYDQGRRGCTNDEAVRAAEDIRKTGDKRVGNQKTPFRPDQFSPIASKLIRQGMALYLDRDEERASIVGAKQMALCLVQFLSQEEIDKLKKLKRNKRFGRALERDDEPAECELPEWLVPRESE